MGYKHASPPPSGISVPEWLRAISHMPAMAEQRVGDLVNQEADGAYRVGKSRSLVIYPGGRFYSFANSMGGYGPVELFMFLAKVEHRDATAIVKAWLAQHTGQGSLPMDGQDDEPFADGKIADLERQSFLDAVLSEAGPLTGSPADVYLRSRGLNPSADDLQHLKWLPTPRGDAAGALLAIALDNNGNACGGQLTWLTQGGQKSTQEPVRQTLPFTSTGRKQGLVRFGSPSNPVVTVCEGLEDALSARQAGAHHVVALLGLGRLCRLEMPANVTTTIVVRDADQPDSPAELTSWRGIVHLYGVGLGVLITPRADDLHHGSKDINDLLQHDPTLAEEMLKTVIARPARLSSGAVSAITDTFSRLPLPRYATARAPLSKLLGWTREMLDKVRSGRIAEHAAGAAADCDVASDEPEPWDDPVTDLASVLDAICVEIRRYVIADERSIWTIALWVAFTHVIHLDQANMDISPRLAIHSPSPICGKSTLLAIVGRLVAKPCMASSITAAVIYRLIEAARPSLLIDEADNLNGLETAGVLRQVLNGGHMRDTAWVYRADKSDNGDGNPQPMKFNSFGAIAFAGIDRLPETLQNRSIVVTLSRMKAGDKREHLRKNRSPVLMENRRKLMRWANDLASLPEIPDMPAWLQNRDGDNWEPLMRIALAAGGHWPERAEKAARFALQHREGEDAQGVLQALLTDLWDIFVGEGHAQLETSNLIDKLLERGDGRWNEANRGKPITEYYLRTHLAPVIPHTEELRMARRWKIGGKAVRGYTAEHFRDAFQRYLQLDLAPFDENFSPGPPSSPGSSVTSVTSAKTDAGTTAYPVTDAVTDRENASVMGVVSSVTGSRVREVPDENYAVTDVKTPSVTPSVTDNPKSFQDVIPPVTDVTDGMALDPPQAEKFSEDAAPSLPAGARPTRGKRPPRRPDNNGTAQPSDETGA